MGKSKDMFFSPYSWIDQVSISKPNRIIRFFCCCPIPAIHVIQVHDVEFADLNIVLTQTLPTLDALRTQGKVRFIGITAYPLEVLK